MFVGDTKKIALGTSSFEKVMRNGALFVDKSLMIEHFLDNMAEVQLIARQRRLGKSLNMDMLRCFLTDKQDHRPLFEHLLVRKSHVWETANSSPVFLLDFNSLRINDYQCQIRNMINNAINRYIFPSTSIRVEDSRDVMSKQGIPVADAIRFLTQTIYEATGSRSFVLIDEYDKILMDNLHDNSYSSLLDFMTGLYTAGLKGNPYLEKALLTGVTRISYEGLLSGLNNLTTYDVFMDSIYSEDYGITEDEAKELSEAVGYDLDEARLWYNGIKIGGKPIYNMYGMMNMISEKTYKCYWGASGTMGIIASIMGAGQKRAIMNLLEPGASENVAIEERISPKQLRENCSDSTFYSLLVQAGYLSLEAMERTTGTVMIPNAELKDVWERFLLSNFFNPDNRISSLFMNVEDPEQFASDLEVYLTNVLDTMSYHDLPMSRSKDGKRRVLERNYHLLLHMVLTAGRDVFQYESIRSNRESGDGRYDILVEFKDTAVVFELKSAAESEDLSELAREALDQIRNSRYGADIGKPIMGVGCAFRKKTCKVVGEEIVTLEQIEALF